MKTLIQIASAAVMVLAIASCTAKVYVMDRHTVMEDEAAGEWPDFDKEIFGKSVEAGPTPFRSTETNAPKKRLYNVLNAEPTSAAKPASATPATKAAPSTEPKTAAPQPAAK